MSHYNSLTNNASKTPGWRPGWSLGEVGMKELQTKLSTEWLGLVLRYDGHWGRGQKPPAFMIFQDTTLHEFQRAVEREVIESGDDHHIFIESLEPDGMWLDIHTGS